MKTGDKISLSFIICFTTIFLIQRTTARIGHFWHITDIHFDKNYSVKGDPSQMCWFTSNHLNTKSESPAAIGNHDCDAPMALVNSAVNAMKTIFPQADFILWTGDDTTHVNDSFFSMEKVVGIINDLTTTIIRSFPNSLVLPVLGNHDLFPQNQAPVGPSELQAKVANLWKRWLDPFNAYSDFKNDGRYVADIPNSKVSFIALNTLLWYESNVITANDPNAADPSAQFAWIDSAIRKIVNNGRKVYIMGHIPPGIFERHFGKQEGLHSYQERYNNKYINMVRRNWQDIPAQFFGHNHFDSFRIFLNDEEKPLAYLLIAPQVSPMRSSISEATGANNPGIRLVSYDTETGEVKEVSQYYMDLEKAIRQDREEWILEYNLTSILNLNKISASSLYDATQRMKEDRIFFDSYYPVNTVQWEKATSCSDQCRQTLLCAYTNVHYTDFYECNSAGEATCLASFVTFTLIVVLSLNFVYRWKL